ncbi:hypothetical protein CAQUA_10700 [Corynebacterium aquatimens]|uniref:Endogenous inhibitor of DNA gyrase (YacG/DUF329 family) n=1 Tax=Corynebacterium aquatimens TaxID=1190508 RepID=A0A931E174_9CORY|nr:endogenous inhibitor of DNA gyrase (YacG/DUF329 family) [Corynebacterium aquatimens]WJY66826.1 hypothetical protein CAQUA_10700 [Corynebacterium aquatimens]
MDLLSSQADNSSAAKKPCPTCQREFDLADAETFPLHLEKRGISWVTCPSSFAEPEQEFKTRVSEIKAPAPVFKPADKPGQTKAEAQSPAKTRPVTAPVVKATEQKRTVSSHAAELGSASQVRHTRPVPQPQKLSLRKNGTVKCPGCKTVLSLNPEKNYLPVHHDPKKRKKEREERAQQRREQRREQRLSDSYALYAHDSFGRSDDGFEPHERMRGETNLRRT